MFELNNSVYSVLRPCFFTVTLPLSDRHDHDDHDFHDHDHRHHSRPKTMLS